ncbi:MAG: BTAD domain-containing putative transcriptional regulator [Acidimicrobiales bacterium]|jgi:predicted ATPase/class 3 adenylate cyclase
MEYRILGPLEVIADDGTPVPLAGVRERTLLASLLLQTNHVVSTDRLIDVLWGEKPPPSASNGLQVHVSKLRRKLEAASAISPIRTEHPGYVLRTLPGELDAERFDELVRSAADMGSDKAITRLKEALSLWRGEVLSGLAPEVFLAESARLEELRLVATERKIEAELTLGRHHELVAELELLASTHPLRERLQGQLMVALYRCGRQADALAAYRRTRTTLAEQLGIDPSVSLQELEVAILNHALGVPESAPIDSRLSASAGGPGTLTFLFTDIEGSTAILRRLGDRYAELLTAHHEIIRNSLAAHNGTEVVTAGDGFFATFASPRACVAAAVEMQRAVAAAPWPAGEVVRVRMGIHTGEASEESTGLVGLDVHKAARIAAVGHGGQVLVSSATAAIVRDALPEDCHLRDLGSHRLKDLGQPEQLFQLDADGLEVDFPPLRSLDNPALPNNLPAQPASFVGRDVEVAEVRRLVGSARLITLTGAGGCGKTRLGLQVAAELLDGSGDGVWLVELASVSEQGAVPAAISEVLGITSRAGRPVLETLLNALELQSVLIVLDNCEHLIEACAEVANAILLRCPRVHLMATSREPLGIGGETIYRVPSLSLPNPDDGDTFATEDSDAVALFVDRARTQGAECTLDEETGPLVVSICRRLDGMPLAIELASARLRSMSLESLHDRLDQRFRLLTGGSRSALPRQQTLRATVDWSYSLLNSPEQSLLRLLSVFAESFSLEAAEKVCCLHDIEEFDVDDLLGSLVDKSLVVAEPSRGRARYRLLETIRQFAAERLVESDEVAAAAVGVAHASYYLSLAELAAPHFFGPEQGRWFARLDADQANLQRAMQHSTAERDGTERVLRFGVALQRYWRVRGRDEEPVSLLTSVLERPEAQADPKLFAAAMCTVAYLSSDTRTALLAGERAVEIARRLDDDRLLIWSLGYLCAKCYFGGDPQRGLQLGKEAVERARALGDEVLLANSLLRYLLCSSTIDPARTEELFTEAIASAERSGDQFCIAHLQNNAGSYALEEGNIPAARSHLEEAVRVSDAIGYVNHYQPIVNLGQVLYEEGDCEGARSRFQDALRISRRAGDRSGIASSNLWLACLAVDSGDWHWASLLHGVAQAFMDQTGEVWEPEANHREAASISAVRTHLGDAEFERAYAEGMRLSAEEGFELALGRVR